jgi:hypothetical protein
VSRNPGAAHPLSRLNPEQRAELLKELARIVAKTIDKSAAAWPLTVSTLKNCIWLVDATLNSATIHESTRFAR